MAQRFLSDCAHSRTAFSLNYGKNTRPNPYFVYQLLVLKAYYDHDDDCKSDVAIWSITLESSITILETPFTLNYDAYSTGISNHDGNLQIW
jgi:hypothetical protein